MDTPTSPLLRRPAELRNLIYILALNDFVEFGHSIDSSVEYPTHVYRFPGLLRTCRQVRFEAGGLFCSLVTIKYHDLYQLIPFLHILEPGWRRAIKTFNFDRGHRGWYKCKSLGCFWHHLGSDGAREIARQHHAVLSYYDLAKADRLPGLQISHRGSVLTSYHSGDNVGQPQHISLLLR